MDHLVMIVDATAVEFLARLVVGGRSEAWGGGGSVPAALFDQT